MPILIRGSGGKVQKIQVDCAIATQEDSAHTGLYKTLKIPFLGNVCFEAFSATDVPTGSGLIITSAIITSSDTNAYLHGVNKDSISVGTVYEFNDGTGINEAIISNGYLTLKCGTSGNYFVRGYNYVTWSD